MTQDAQAPGRIGWEPAAKAHFETILEEIPAMIRGIAETRVSKKAQTLAREDGRGEITEKDMVDAFFAETPAGFMEPMKASMRELKIDTTAYGHPA